MVDKYVIKKVDNYEDALLEMKKNGNDSDEVIRYTRKRALKVVCGVLAINCLVVLIGVMAGMKIYEIFLILGITILISAPILGYGTAKIKDDSRRLKICRSYQDGTRFNDMTKEEVIDFCNSLSEKYDRLNAKKQ